MKVGVAKSMDVSISIGQFHRYLHLIDLSPIVNFLTSEEEKSGEQEGYSSLVKVLDLFLSLHLSDNLSGVKSLQEFIGIPDNLKLINIELNQNKGSILLSFKDYSGA